MAHNLVSEKYCADHFIPKTGVTAGTDDAMQLSAAEIEARYQVTISPSSGNLLPAQSEVESAVVNPTVGNPVVTQIHLDEISATIIINANGNKIKYIGFAWSTYSVANPTSLYDFPHSRHISYPNAIWSGQVGGVIPYIGHFSPTTLYYITGYCVTENDSVTFSSEISQYTAGPPLLNVSSRSNTLTPYKSIWIDGSITFANGYPITEKGIVISQTNNLPNIDEDTKHINTNSGTEYSEYIGNLTPNIIYFVRAYAFGYGVGYSSVLSFVLDGTIPVIQTSYHYPDIHSGYMSLAAFIDCLGYPEYTLWGFVYSTDPNPTYDNSLRTYEEYGGLGWFRSTIPDLVPNTKYYTRAYIVNSLGIFYADDVEEHTTSQAIPTGDISIINLGQTNAIIQLQATSGSPITSISLNGETLSDGSESIVVYMENLTPNTEYIVSGSITNSAGTADFSYQFTTQRVLVYPEGAIQLNDLYSTSAVLEIYATAGLPMIEIGLNGESASGVDSLQISLSNLTPGTEYMISGYLINSDGYTDLDITFTTPNE